MTTETTSELCDRLDALAAAANRPMPERLTHHHGASFSQRYSEWMAARLAYEKAMRTDAPDLVRRLRVAKRALEDVALGDHLSDWARDRAERALREMGETP